MAHQWKIACDGRMSQIKLTNGADIAALKELDRKEWIVMSCPTTGVRFDERMLELMDSDKDGRIRMPEVLAAIEYLETKGVALDSLFRHDEADEKALADVVARQAALEEPLSDEDKQALSNWEARGSEPAVAILGEATAEAEAVLKQVELIIDGYFTPAEDLPLVMEEEARDLPLDGRINLKYIDSITEFRMKCVEPILGAGKASLSYLEWKDIKQRFTAYRGWVESKPAKSAPAKDKLDDEERILRYKLHLLEFLENYVNMRRLYKAEMSAIFQTGILRIDGRELNLCFHVDNEGAHSALSGKSKCCVLYLKLTRPAEKAERSVCAVVTAGTIGGLYVGRNGVFNDRDGKDWEAVVTKVVEAQVSLAEAFWLPWKKIGEGIAGMVKKFLGSKQAAATTTVSQGVEKTVAKPESGGGAAMASSVAAIGIGIGMVGAALASLMAAVSRMSGWQLVISVIAVILVVSLPSVVLTWFKLRQRDLGAILNACGWAVNRPMYFSMLRAKSFTKCAKDHSFWRVMVVIVILLVSVIAAIMIYEKPASCQSENNINAETSKEVVNNEQSK